MARRSRRFNKRRTCRRRRLEDSEDVLLEIPLDPDQPRETIAAWMRRRSAARRMRAAVGRPTSSPPKRKSRRSSGRPPEYEYDRIERVTEDYVRKYGLPHTAALLMEKVADACDEAQPLITLPGDTQFKIFVRALHRRIKQRLQGRKFRK
jgi:hypothetical protein